MSCSSSSSTNLKRSWRVGRGHPSVVAEQVAGQGEQVLEVEGTGPALARAVFVVHRQRDAEEVLAERRRLGNAVGSGDEQIESRLSVRRAGR